MQTPEYDLPTAQVLANLGSLRMGLAACFDRLQVVFDGPNGKSRARKFAKEVIAKLIPGDFCHKRALPSLSGKGAPRFYDVYAIRLDQTFLSGHGLSQVDGNWPTTWYLKYAIITVSGRQVDLLSLHCLEHEIETVGGTRLTPEWDDGHR